MAFRWPRHKDLYARREVSFKWAFRYRGSSTPIPKAATPDGPPSCITATIRSQPVTPAVLVRVALAATLFDAGLRRAQRDEQIAAYDAAVASYRQTVLTAFREVEDALSTMRILADEASVQQQALAAARQSLELTTNQYKAGLVGLLNVVVVQAQAFSEERNAIELQGRRYAATVDLIKALGGGFSAANP